MFSTLTLSLTFVGIKLTSILKTYFSAVDSQDTTCTYKHHTFRN